jgi:hypothetical protein
MIRISLGGNSFEQIVVKYKHLVQLRSRRYINHIVIFFRTIHLSTLLLFFKSIQHPLLVFFSILLYALHGLAAADLQRHKERRLLARLLSR